MSHLLEQAQAKLAQIEAGIKRPTAINDGVVLVCGNTMVPKPIAWLWPAWLALGKFHLLAGAPGQGKTTINLSFIAILTSGGRWPDGSRCSPGNALIWSGEDDPQDTLLPRLLAAGADPSRVFFVTGARVNGEVQPFDPSRDMVALQGEAERIGGVRLIMIDPVANAVTGDSHKNTETRRSLQPLVDLAANMNAALVGITHFSKAGQGSDPASRVLGSVAFVALARIVLVAAKVRSEDGDDRRILARAKSNLGEDSGGFEYCLEQVEPLPGIHASRVSWGAAVQGTARELLSDPDEQPEDDAASDVTVMLRAELTAATWTNADVACQPLKDAGFSKKQIWAASKKLNVVRKKGGMKEGWYWRLPVEGSQPLEDSAEGSEDSNLLNGEPSESSGHLESSAADESVEVFQ